MSSHRKTTYQSCVVEDEEVALLVRPTERDPLDVLPLAKKKALFGRHRGVVVVVCFLVVIVGSLVLFRRGASSVLVSTTAPNLKQQQHSALYEEWKAQILPSVNKWQQTAVAPSLAFSKDSGVWDSKEQETARHQWDQQSGANREWFRLQTLAASGESSSSVWDPTKVADWWHRQSQDTQEWFRQHPVRPAVQESEREVQDWWSRESQEVQKEFSTFWNKAGNATGDFVGSESNTLKEWWNGASEATRAWVRKAAVDSSHTLQQATNATGAWLAHETQETGHQLQQTEEKANRWFHKEANSTASFLNKEEEATGEWFKDEHKKMAELAQKDENATAAWLHQQEKKSGQWFKDEEKKTREWFQEEEKKAAKGLKKDENATAAWLDEEKKKTRQWIQQEEEKTGEWIQNEKNKTGEWFKDEVDKAEKGLEKDENATAAWFQTEVTNAKKGLKKDENATVAWFKTEVNKAEKGLKKDENATAAWFHEEEDKTKEWFAEEEEKAQDWFKNESTTTKHWFSDEAVATRHWYEHETDAIKSWWNTTKKRIHNTTQHVLHGDEVLLYLNNTDAYSLLMNGFHWFDNSHDYFLLQQGLDAQINQAYCPIASAVAILNSLRPNLTLPVDPSYDPYPYATQDNLFNNCTNEHVIRRNDTYDGIFAAPGGLGMDQTKALLECHLLPKRSWSVEAHHLDPAKKNLDQMREDLVTALRTAEARVLINYDRSAVGQIGHGHWSPLGSYSYEKDAFLVMDVAKYKYPAAWIPTTMLYMSLSTQDACGSWDYPQAQDKVSPRLLHSTEQEDFIKAMEHLGCESTYRGYIIVKSL